MTDKVIEPSEILVDADGTVRDDPIRANPWLRFLGRMFDYSIFCLLLLGVQRFAKDQIPFGDYDFMIPYEYFIWIPLEALFLSTWGLTPGKWLVGATIYRGRVGKFDFPTALRRSFSVWFRGIGMGIIGINILCMLVAYHRLRLFKITSWDRDENIHFSHKPIPPWRVYAAGIIAIAGLIFYHYAHS